LAAAAGAGRTLAGLAFVGLWMPEPGVVIHGAEGAVSVGDPAGGATERARRLHDLLAPSWDVTLSEDIALDQWRKLLWNVGFNALCAVTGATAGEALAVPDSRALVREAMFEVVTIARRHAIELDVADVDEMAAHNEQLRDYRPSTARDLDEAKQVEREALCGFVVREGKRLGLDVPVNRVLDGLLALQEARSRDEAG
ncbi:MAG: ketopantoate reductase family protein, partial [Miltoncostaeaceae bacterium]